MRPTIGIGCDYEVGKRESCKLHPDYVEAVRDAGAVPVVLPPIPVAEHVADLLERIDGVVVPGGADIDPERFGQGRHPATSIMPERRYAFDRMLLEAALARGMPVLAICYGVQLLNVVLGGDLIQDIPSLVPGAIAHRASQAEIAAAEAAGLTRRPPMARHEVSVEPGSHLHEVLGRGRLDVSSSHHQAVGRVAPCLRIAARAADGVVEAVEPAARDGRLVLGVQWHPEHEGAVPRGMELFRALRDAAAVHAERRAGKA